MIRDMPILSRRGFARRLPAVAVSMAAPAAAASSALEPGGARISLDGEWEFRLDSTREWTPVTVPHTWQVKPETAGYLGVAWYRRTVEAPPEWMGRTVRVEFEAVTHSARVLLNGAPVGEHVGKAYTAFTVDLSPALRPGTNTLEVRADNSFNQNMLPRGGSYDWTTDGGLIRPVALLITPQTFIERVEVDANPNLKENAASINVRAVVRNAGEGARQVRVGYEVVDKANGRVVLRGKSASSTIVRPAERQTIASADARLEKPRLWHFDHPNLYRIRVWIEAAGQLVHEMADTFGIRRIEVRDSAIYLNGERVRLMGVERMGGSDPRFGMAEPEWLIRRDHDDMKELNCVFTRVHWQQDRRVLDYCDRNGILIQVEVPSWGGKTFEGMSGTPSPAIMENGLQQLREMVARERNHPSVFSWGLCNEVNGQNPPAYAFVERMYAEIKKLDPSRPATYASNSLQKTPANDAARLMDIVFWNEYYESWYKGTLADLRRNLEQLRSAFPGKPVVVSEYGLCECTPEHIAGDAARIGILRTHTGIYREYDFVAGAIFFCYNDYRTHIGDKGIGAMKQRVHGVVDLYGRRKPSFDSLRKESSPVESLEVSPEGATLRASVRLRKTLPAYPLEGFRLRWIVYAHGDLPMEQRETPLQRMTPGETRVFDLPFDQKGAQSVRVDVMRPTGFSALEAWWQP
jgi:beta-galactosidase